MWFWSCFFFFLCGFCVITPNATYRSRLFRRIPFGPTWCGFAPARTVWVQKRFEIDVQQNLPQKHLPHTVAFHSDRKSPTGPGLTPGTPSGPKSVGIDRCRPSKKVQVTPGFWGVRFSAYRVNRKNGVSGNRLRFDVFMVPIFHLYLGPI